MKQKEFWIHIQPHNDCEIWSVVDFNQRGFKPDERSIHVREVTENDSLAEALTKIAELEKKLEIAMDVLWVFEFESTEQSAWVDIQYHNRIATEAMKKINTDEK